MTARPPSGPSHMPQNDVVLELFCLVEGDESVFDIVISVNSRVTALKRLIHAECKNSAVANTDAKDLTLWKLQEPIPVGPDDTLAERVKLLGHDFSNFAIRLSAENKLLAVFQQKPSEDHLHILVQLPPVKAAPSSTAPESAPAHAEVTGEAPATEVPGKNKPIGGASESNEAKMEESLKAKFGRNISGRFGNVFPFQGKPKVETITSDVEKSPPKVEGPAPSAALPDEDERGIQEGTPKAATTPTNVDENPSKVDDAEPSASGAKGTEGKETVKARLARHISRSSSNLFQGKPKTDTVNPVEAGENPLNVDSSATAATVSEVTKEEKKVETLRAKLGRRIPSRVPYLFPFQKSKVDIATSSLIDDTSSAPPPEETKVEKKDEELRGQPETETTPSKGEDFPSTTDPAPSAPAPASEETKEEKETLKTRLGRRISVRAANLLQFQAKRKADTASPAKGGESPSKIDDPPPSAPSPRENKDETKEKIGEPTTDATIPTKDEVPSQISDSTPSAPAPEERKEEKKEETVKTGLARRFSGRASNLLQFQGKPKTTTPPKAEETPLKIDDPVPAPTAEGTREGKKDESLATRLGHRFSARAGNLFQGKSGSKTSSAKVEETPSKIDDRAPSASAPEEAKAETKEEILEVELGRRVFRRLHNMFHFQIKPEMGDNTPAIAQEPRGID